jgi:hypothetical protein
MSEYVPAGMVGPLPAVLPPPHPSSHKLNAKNPTATTSICPQIIVTRPGAPRIGWRPQIRTPGPRQKGHRRDHPCERPWALGRTSHRRAASALQRNRSFMRGRRINDQGVSSRLPRTNSGRGRWIEARISGGRAAEWGTLRTPRVSARLPLRAAVPLVQAGLMLTCTVHVPPEGILAPLQVFAPRTKSTAKRTATELTASGPVPLLITVIVGFFRTRGRGNESHFKRIPSRSSPW